jgi:hypothetical protein
MNVMDVFLSLSMVTVGFSCEAVEAVPAVSHALPPNIEEPHRNIQYSTPGPSTVYIFCRSVSSYIGIYEKLN